MRLTPADVHNVAFKKPSIGKRGYDEDEVDAFLDLVEAELAHLIEENNELTQRLATQPSSPVEQGEQDIQDDSVVLDLHKATDGPDQAPDAAPAEPVAQAPAAAPVGSAAGPADHHLQAARLLGLAQDTADRLTTEAATEAEQVRSTAKADSEKMLGDARTESERMRTDAKNESDKLRVDAKNEADRLVTDAKNTSERMVGEATVKADALQRDSRVKAEKLDREAQDKYNQVIGDLGTQRSTLETKIDDLRSYEREYRGRLREWITSHLTQLDDDGAVPSTDGAAEQRDGAHAGDAVSTDRAR